MSDTVIHVTDDSFDSEVLQSDVPVLVDFWAPWCGPCKMIAPVLEKIAEENGDNVVIAKVNTDEDPEWAMKLGVQGIPTLLFIHKGAIVDRLVGAHPAHVVQDKVDELIHSSKESEVINLERSSA